MKKLLSFIESKNIAEELDDSVLAALGARVVEQFDQDYESMSHWLEMNKKGEELSRPDLNPRTSPWQGAANYKSTAIMQVSNSFADRASAELLKDENLVMMDIIGNDKDGKKKAIADRVAEYENYHINYKMDYRNEQSDMLYKLAKYGCLFKKVYYDVLEQKKVSCLIEYPNFAVSMGNKSLERCRSFTEIQHFSRNEALEFEALGYWLPCGETVDMQTGSNAAEGVENAYDNTECYYVQNTYFDLVEDGTGYEQPYIVTYHKGSDKVVRVVADFTEQDIIIKNNDAILSVKDARKDGDAAFNAIMATADMVKINRNMGIVKYGFIRGDGFLDIGYFYLLAALTNLVNTTTNQLIDAGTISNLGGGFLAKEFRGGPNQKGMTGFKPSELKQTDISAAMLQNSILFNPVREPSQTLLQLNEITKAEIDRFGASIDLSALVSGNVAPTTAMISVSEQMIPVSAIYQYIQRSMSKEFELLARLTPEYCSEAEYQEVVGEDGSIESDYSSSVTIKTTAQKQMSTEVQRIFEIQALQTMLPQIQAAGGNAVKVLKQGLSQFKAINTDDILPEMDEAQEAEANAKMRASQAKQEQLLDLQIAAANAEAEGFKAQQIAYQTKQQKEFALIDSELKLNDANINKIKAQTIKEWEDAQSLAIKNDMINTGIKKAMDSVMDGVISQPEMEEDGKPEMEQKMERKMEHKEEMMGEKKEESSEEKPMVDIEIKTEE